MIISPSTSTVLRGIIHELSGTFKDDLDPVKSAQIETVIGVLGSCAVRIERQSYFIKTEAEAIKELGEEFVANDIATESLKLNLDALKAAKKDEELYECASQTLSTMSDIGSDAGHDLSEKLYVLLEQRLANELEIIGGGFEAAGRG